MQTSLIKIGETYALKFGNDPIVRFTVESIKTVTVRKSQKASPADTKNTICGEVAEADLSLIGRTNRYLEVEPDNLIGGYTEFVELKAKEEEENRILAEEKKLAVDQAQKLQATLYQISGIERPERKHSWSEPIGAAGYGGSVTIDKEAVGKLLEALEKWTN